MARQHKQANQECQAPQDLCRTADCPSIRGLLRVKMPREVSRTGARWNQCTHEVVIGVGTRFVHWERHRNRKVKEARRDEATGRCLGLARSRQILCKISTCILWNDQALPQDRGETALESYSRSRLEGEIYSSN